MSTRPRPSLAPILAVAAAALALPAAPARAGDGVVELNQASALAGNPSIGDVSPGFPIRIDKPGSYRLTSNLNHSGTNTELIDVDADHVTIDLNGFVVGACIGAAGVCIPLGAGNGIDAFGDSDLTIRNGTIQGLPGFAVRAGARARVENVVVRAVSSSGILLSGHGVVRGSSIVDSGTTGITAGIVAGAGSLVSENVISGNGQTGVSADDGSVVEGNTITDNGADGIQAFGAILVRGNMVRANGDLGLDCSAAFANSVAYVENTFQSNDGDAEPQVSSSCVNLGSNLCRSGANATCP